MIREVFGARWHLSRTLEGRVIDLVVEGKGDSDEEDRDDWLSWVSPVSIQGLLGPNGRRTNEDDQGNDLAERVSTPPVIAD